MGPTGGEDVSLMLETPHGSASLAELLERWSPEQYSGVSLRYWVTSSIPAPSELESLPSTAREGLLVTIPGKPGTESVDIGEFDLLKELTSESGNYLSIKAVLD